jgi:hypothetical protein
MGDALFDDHDRVGVLFLDEIANLVDGVANPPI